MAGAAILFEHIDQFGLALAAKGFFRRANGFFRSANGVFTPRRSAPKCATNNKTACAKGNCVLFNFIEQNITRYKMFVISIKSYYSSKTLIKILLSN